MYAMQVGRQGSEIRDDVSVTATSDYSQGSSRDDAGLSVQRLFKTWSMGQLDAAVFLDALNMLPEIKAIGGVSLACKRRVEEHQFDHDLPYSDFLRTLRNTGKPMPVEDYLDFVANKKSAKKIIQDPGGDGLAKDLLFPGSREDQEEGTDLGIVSVVSGKPIMTGGQRHASNGVASALTGDMSGMVVEDSSARPYHGLPDQVGFGVDDPTEKAEKHGRKHYTERDDIGNILAECGPPEKDAYHLGTRRRRVPDRQYQGGMHAALFGGGRTVKDSLEDYDDEPSDRRPGAGRSAAHERPIGKRMYQDTSAYGNMDNNHIAVGDHVNQFGQMTTQELLWGNMIRRAR
jgi:hypothetical protein